MAADLILTAICAAAVIFLVYFLVALYRDSRKHSCFAFLLRFEPAPDFDNTSDGVWKQPLSVTVFEQHHRPRRRHLPSLGHSRQTFVRGLNWSRSYSAKPARCRLAQ